MEFMQAQKIASPIKIGSVDFVKRVDEIVAQRQATIMMNVFSDIEFGESEEAFKKLLRNNSKKYYKRALRMSKDKCSICNWGNDVPECLHVHHILPVKDYHHLFYKDHIIPEEAFEISNLIVLCPNCHALLHKAQGKNNANAFKTFMLQAVSEGQLELCVALMKSTLFFERYNINKNNDKNLFNGEE